MKIAIITPGGITNFGERAIMLGTVYDLREKYPSAQITIFGYQTLKDDDERLYKELEKLDVKYDSQLVNGSSFISKSFKIAGLLIYPKLFLPSHQYNYLKEARIFSKGQESLTQSYGFIHFIDSFIEQLIASRINKDISLYGHSIGPIYKYKRLCAFILHRFAKVYVRDSRSHELLLSLNYDETKIVDVKDLAYKAVEKYDLGELSKSKGHYLLVPNAAICRTKEIEAQYIQNLHLLIKYLLLKKQKLIIGSSVITTDWNNDYRLCQRLKDDYPELELRHYMQLHEFLRDVKSAKMTISSRLHPLIMSNGLGTGVLAVSRSPKVIGLLTDLGLDQNIIDPFNKLNQKQVEALL